MENLTRNNYEIWFLDYLDGQLSDEQLETLLEFLESNPDLKAELRGITRMTLPAGTESLARKEQLLRSEEDIPGISPIDQLCIARMENDLTTEEAEGFDRRMDEDMELGAAYAAFRHTRLDASKAVVFPDKKGLLRKDPRKKTILLSPWVITAISSAAVLMLIWILWPSTPDAVTPVVAKTGQPATRNLQPATGNLQHATGNLQPATRNPQPAPVLLAGKKPVASEISTRESVPMIRLSHRSNGAGPRIPDPRKEKLMLASVSRPGTEPVVATGRALTIPQYALQLFRERILGEDRQLVKRTRFSMWEVAGAGVNKINDLTGTKMKLNREYDSKGDILAVSFNSRLIDVESPVKTQ